MSIGLCPYPFPAAGLMSPLALRVMYEPGVLAYVAYECGGETFGELSCDVGAD